MKFGRLGIFCLSIIAAFAVILAVVRLWPREPSYAGHSLTWWLQDLYTAIPNRNSVKEKLATEAIQQIGTNALPTLLAITRARDSRLKQTAMTLLAKQKLLRFAFIPADQRRYWAALGYRALGSAAKADIPALTICLTNDNPPSMRQCAALALGNIGPDAKAATAALLITAKDKDNDVRNDSLWALGRIHPDLELVIDGLIEGLDDSYSLARENAASALASYGAAATGAVPALVRTLTNNRGAGFSLRQIDPEAATKAGVK